MFIFSSIDSFLGKFLNRWNGISILVILFSSVPAYSKEPFVDTESCLNLLKITTPVRIVDLNDTYRDEAVAEIQSQFIWDREGDAWKTIPENFNYLASETYRKNDRRNRYWVLIDEMTGKVIGGVGIYKKGWWQNEVWLNWFFVRPKYRNRGLGRLLLEKAVAESNAVGARRLRVYTSDRPREFDPRILYLKIGMTETKKEPEVFAGKPTGVNTVYLSLDLKP